MKRLSDKGWNLRENRYRKSGGESGPSHNSGSTESRLVSASNMVGQKQLTSNQQRHGEWHAGGMKYSPRATDAHKNNDKTQM